MNKYSSAGLVFRGQHHAVVVRIADRLKSVDAGKVVIGKYLLIGRHRPTSGGILHDDRRLVLIGHDVELVAGAALIIDFDGERLAQLALDAEIELRQVGAAKVRVDSPERQDTHGSVSRPLLPEIRNQWHILVEANAPRECSRLGGAGDL